MRSRVAVTNAVAVPGVELRTSPAVADRITSRREVIGWSMKRLPAVAVSSTSVSGPCGRKLPVTVRVEALNEIDPLMVEAPSTVRSDTEVKKISPGSVRLSVRV